MKTNTNEKTAAELTLGQKNANARKEATQAAKNAVLSLYKQDRIAFLHDCLFDKNDRAYTQTVEYTAYKYDESKNAVVPYTATATLRVTLFDFVTEKDSRATVKDRVEKIALLASDSTKESRAAAIPYIRNVCTLLGLHACGESVNERDAKRIMKAAYTVTDKNDDTAKEREVRRAICAMLWAMTEKHESTNAYKAAKEAAAKERAAKEREKEAAKAEREKAKAAAKEAAANIAKATENK